MDWRFYPSFTEDEFRCKHSKLIDMDVGFMRRLQNLRMAYGRPMKITSGYRDKSHPIEAKKETPGAHSTGHACDVAVRGYDALRLVQLAIVHGFTGIGVQQKGDVRFIHLDDLKDSDGFTRPTIWSY